ncbi:MAG: WD40 repeat domain-containing protein, partial [Limisphaerales bacterium]
AAFRILHSQRETAQQLYYANLTLAQRHLEEGAPDRAMEVLLQCPEKFRHWEWGHLVSECHREVLTLTNAVDTSVKGSGTSYVLALPWKCQFHPDNRRLAAMHPTGRVWVWEMPSGRILWQFDRSAHRVANITLSPDWRDLAMVTTNGVEIVPVGGSEPRLRLEPNAPSVQAIAFSPDGQTIATVVDDGVRLWASEGGGAKGGFPVRPHTQTLFFTPDGGRLIASTGISAAIYEVATGQRLRELGDPSSDVIALFHDRFGERYVTADRAKQLRLWTTNGLIDELELAETARSDIRPYVAFSPDGSWFGTGSDNMRATVREARTGKVAISIPDQVRGMVFSPDGTRVATRGGDTAVRVWTVNDGQPFPILRGHREMLNDLAFSPDGRLLASVDASGVVKVWSASPGRELFPVEGFVWALSQSGDGRLAAVVPLPYGLRIWDTRSGRIVADLGRERRQVYASSFSPDGEHVATGGTPGEACIWNFKTGQLVHVLRGHSNSIAAYYSPDGRRLATIGFDGVAKIWDPDTGTELRTLRGHTRLLNYGGFSPDGRQLATASNDLTVRVWDVETGECLRILRGHSDWVSMTRFSPDGRVIASTSTDGSLRLWSARTGEPLARWNLRGVTWDLDFSPDGRRIVVKTSKVSIFHGDRPVTEIWDVETGRSVLAFRGRSEMGTITQFSPDGRRLLTDWWELQIRQWESFPWHEREYPGPTSQPLPERIRLYADRYWADRLAAEGAGSRPDPVVVWQRFTGAEVPTRDPATSAGCLDLTDHYTGTLNMISHMDFNPWLEGDYLQPLPKGAVQFGGVGFDVRGLIQLPRKDELGPCFEQFWRQYPERVEGIPVGRAIRQLHALLGATWGAPDGTAIGSLILRYADGQQHDLEIQYGRHVRNWWTNNDAKPVDLGKVAWYQANGVSDEMTSQGTSIDLRLFQCHWPNPRPEVEVVCVDFVSHMTTSAPFVIALTVE